MDAKHINTNDIHNTFFTEFGQTAIHIAAFIHNRPTTTESVVNEEEFGFLDEAPKEETPFLNFKPKKPVEETPAEPSPLADLDNPQALP